MLKKSILCVIVVVALSTVAFANPITLIPEKTVVLNNSGHKINGYKYLCMEEQGNLHDLEDMFNAFFAEIGFTILTPDDEEELEEEEKRYVLYGNYETKIVELQQKLDTLLWEKESAEKNLTVYEDLESDMAKLYNQGYISQTEYLSSRNNLNSNIIKKVSNLIDLIIYNDDVISNFVSEKFEIK